MWMIGLLVPLLCLIGLVGYIWLCVVAFKRHPGWGLLVLFLSPITAVVFALKHWQESKKPFLVYMGSFVGCVALAVYLFSTVGLQMMALAEQASAEASTAMTDQQAGAEAGSGEAEAEAPAPAPSEGTGALDPEEEAEMRQAAETMREMNTAEATDESQPAGTEPGATKSDTLAGADLASDLPPAGNLSDMVPPGFHLVPVGKAGDYIGKKIRIVGKDGKEIEGRLTDASPHVISVERTLSSGTITFDLAANEVKTLLVAYQ